ncbi:hypothetical protein D3C84_916360 [compost metagenome]
MEQAHSTTPINAASKRVRAGKSSRGASHIALITNAWRKPVKPEVSLSKMSSWVMPEKYQKNRNSQPNPAQSKPFAVVLLRLNKLIKRSSPYRRSCRHRIGDRRHTPSNPKGGDYCEPVVKKL